MKLVHVKLEVLAQVHDEDADKLLQNDQETVARLAKEHKAGKATFMCQEVTRHRPSGVDEVDWTGK